MRKSATPTAAFADGFLYGRAGWWIAGRADFGLLDFLVSCAGKADSDPLDFLGSCAGNLDEAHPPSYTCSFRIIEANRPTNRNCRRNSGPPVNSRDTTVSRTTKAQRPGDFASSGRSGRFARIGGDDLYGYFRSQDRVRDCARDPRNTHMQRRCWPPPDTGGRRSLPAGSMRRQGSATPGVGETKTSSAKRSRGYSAPPGSGSGNLRAAAIPHLTRRP
jgi:hypothetical protein